MNQALTAVILAAGHGTRMRSRTPKVLHPICGRPMVDWVLAAVTEAGAKDVKVIANPHHADVAAHLDGRVELARRVQRRPQFRQLAPLGVRVERVADGAAEPHADPGRGMRIVGRDAEDEPRGEADDADQPER